MPISLADGWEAVEEERRLLYVGITRAREHLLCPGPGPGRRAAGRTASPHGSSTACSAIRGGPTRAVAGAAAVEEAVEEAGTPTPARGGRGARPPPRAAACGAVLSSGAERKVGRCAACPPTYDEELFERLRGWRAGTAAEAKVPAYVVFTDATLVAIAETMPQSLAALARIAGVGPAKLERYGADVLAELGVGAGGADGAASPGTPDDALLPDR